MKTSKRRGRKWLGWAARAIALGTVYQRLASRRDLRRLPPTGELIDIGGGRKLHLTRQGVGAPPVVFDAGLGGSGLSWGEVVPGTAAFAEAIAFDRAGYGYSDAGPEPRTSRRIVEELHTLLERAGVKPPFVLAGHSFGGINARLYAATYPEQVAGLVLVDPSHEDQLQFTPAALALLTPLIYRLLGFCTRIGLTRVVLGSGHLPGMLGQILGKFPERDRPRALAEVLRNRYWRCAVSELTHLGQSFDQMRAAHAATPLADIPVIVVSAANRTGKPLSQVRASMRRLMERFNGFHGELAQLSPSGKLVVAEQSSHLVPFDAPETVVEAIRTVVEEARRRADQAPRR